MYTGVDNLKTYMSIDKWNRHQHVSYWNTERCNMINGTGEELTVIYYDLHWPVALAQCANLDVGSVC